jgi:hypothetical protein
MDFGAAMFFTEYSMEPAELATALEARGFESMWAAEHSHIPTSRRTPFPQGGELPRKYCDAMDPFVSLTAAATTTKTLKVGTGVCLVAQGSGSAAASPRCRDRARRGELNSAPANEILPVLDRWAELIRQLV